MGNEAVSRGEAANGSSAQIAGSAGGKPPGDRLLRSRQSRAWVVHAFRALRGRDPPWFDVPGRQWMQG
jgi:hypothetical protein